MKRRKAYATLQDFFNGNPDLAQHTFAKRLNITQGHLSLILSGERTPSLPLALKIAAKANIPVESLVGKLHAADVA